MSQIITRAAKGSPLTNAELDSNFINLDNDKAELTITVTKDSNTGAAQIPSGTSFERPGAGSAGLIRFNTDEVTFEGHNGTTWADLSTNLSDLVPYANNIGSPGLSTEASRGDHVHPSDTSKANVSAETAVGTSFTPSGTISATNVQTAIQELDSELNTGLASKGDVNGPNNVTDNYPALFDGTSGKLLKQGVPCLPLTGGTLTGDLLFNYNATNGKLVLDSIKKMWMANNAGITFESEYILLDSQNIVLGIPNATAGDSLIVAGLTPNGNVIVGVKSAPPPAVNQSATNSNNVTIKATNTIAPSPFIDLGLNIVLASAINDGATISLTLLLSNTTTRYGTCEIEFRKNGVKAGTIIVDIPEIFEQTVAYSYPVSSPLAANDTISVWARVSSNSNDQFELIAKATAQSPSKLNIASLASGGGGGGAVESVNGKTGVVVLTSLDVNAVSNVTGSAPISSSGGLTPQISISEATTSAAGSMSAADKLKLDGVATGATAYTHPANHPPSIITQDASNRFVTDAEKSSWNNKASVDNANQWSQMQTFGAAIVEKYTAIAASAINCALASVFSKTITATTTFTISGVATSGSVTSFVLELTFGSTLYSVNWWSGIKWAGGTVPTFTASSVNILGFYTRDGGITWRGMVMSKDSR